MSKSPIDTVVDAIAVAAELTQTSMSAVAMSVLARDLLQSYPVPAVLKALDRCRRELRRPMRQADIEDFIHSADGRPGPDEAWGLVAQLGDEGATVVINSEIAEAWGVALPVLSSGDKIGARRTFIETYERITRQAREKHIAPPTWYPSLGADPARREDAIRAAKDRGLLTGKQAATYLPAPVSREDAERGAVIAGLLSGKVVKMPEDVEFGARIERLKATLKGVSL